MRILIGLVELNVWTLICALHCLNNFPLLGNCNFVPELNSMFKMSLKRVFWSSLNLVLALVQFTWATGYAGRAQLSTVSVNN